MTSSTYSLLLTALLALVLTACGESDPRKESLEKGVQLASDIVSSHVLIEAVKNADPEMHATTAASAAVSGGITSNFRLPPENIGIEAALKPGQPWYVIIKGDDANKQVIIEGYGDNLTEPLITKTITFPPQ